MAETLFPTREIAARIARLQADPRTRAAGIAYQTRFQHFLPDEELARVGLSRTQAPKPGLLKGLVGATFDVLSRPSQAVLRGIQGVRQGSPTGVIGGVYGGLTGRGQRANIFDALGEGPSNRRTFLGIREGTAAGRLAEIAGEAALDPLTYLTFGGGQVARRGTEAAARLFGSEAAEQVARRGVGALDDVQRATLRGELGDKFFETYVKRARGGVMLGRNRTLIPSETFRQPLRRAKILDETRRAAGGIAPTTGTPTLQSAIRNNEAFNKLRSLVTNRGDLRARFGGSAASEATSAEMAASATAGQLNEAAMLRLESAIKPLNAKLRKGGASAEEIYAVRRAVLDAIDTPNLENGGYLATLENLKTMVPGDAVDEVESFLNTLRFEMGITTQTAVNLGDPTTLRRFHSPTEGPDLGTLNARKQKGFDWSFGDETADLGRPSAAPFTPEMPPSASTVRGQIPGQETITDLGLPRVPTHEARRLADELSFNLDDVIQDVQMDLTLGPTTFEGVKRGNINAVNDRLTEVLNERAVAAGRKPITSALETDPARLVGINTVQVNRAVAASELSDRLSRVVIPDTDQALIIRGGSDIAAQVPKDYKQMRLGYESVWAPVEMAPDIARFNKVALSNPTDFGNFYDKYLNLWKSFATVPVPFSVGFHSRNLTGNLFNNWIAGGIKLAHYKRAHELQSKIDAARKELAERVARGDLDPAALRTRSLVDDVPTPTPTGRFRDPLGPPEPVSMKQTIRYAPESIQSLSNEQLLDILNKFKRIAYSKPSTASYKGAARLKKLREEAGLPPPLKDTDAPFQLGKNAAMPYPRLGDNLNQAQLEELSVIEEEISRRVAAGFPKQGRLTPISGVDLETGERLMDYAPGLRTPNVELRDLTGYRGAPKLRALGDMPEFEDALRAVGATDEEVELIMQMRSEGVITSGYYRNDLHENALQELTPEEIDNFVEALTDPAKMVQYWREALNNPQRVGPIKAGANLGHRIESNARMAHYLGKLDEGYSAANAMLSVKKHLFDYSDLTTFERNVMRRIIPFYTFMRFNTPLQFQMFVTQPRKLLAANRVQQSIAAIGGDPDTDFSDKALSSWAVGAGDQPLSKMLSNMITQGRGDPVVMGLDLPSIAAIEAIEPWVLTAASVMPGLDRILPTADDPKDSFLSLLSLSGGGPVELVKFLVEEGTNTDLFTGAPVEGRNTLMALFESQMPLKGKANSVMKRLVRPSGSTEGDDAKLSIFNLLTGIAIISSGMNFYQITPQRQRGEMYGVLDQLDAAIRAAKRDGVDVPTLTELREAGLVPTLRDIARSKPAEEVTLKPKVNTVSVEIANAETTLDRFSVTKDFLRGVLDAPKSATAVPVPTEGNRGEATDLVFYRVPGGVRLATQNTAGTVDSFEWFIPDDVIRKSVDTEYRPERKPSEKRYSLAP